MTVYALLVGTNAYEPPVPPLRGSLNDIASAGRYLATRIAEPGSLRVKELRDGEATKAAVIDGFRSHLGQAGPGDSALFWFSGHGSLAPVPPRLAHLEPTGMMQTLVCADSRRGRVTDLLDKELSLLIAEVAAGGAHVSLVLDCCHAHGATREAPDPRPPDPVLASFTARRVDALEEPPPLDLLLAELSDPDRVAELAARDAADPGKRDHVALCACQSHQNAFEFPFGERACGVFSLAVLEQLEQLGPSATYRELMTGARSYVENRYPAQLPTLYPADGDTADRPFLGGELRLPTSPLVMYWADAKGRWEVDAGACHGLQRGTDGDRTRFGVVDGEPTQQVAVAEVLLDRSVVKPLPGWSPDPGRRSQYPVVVTAVPVPSVRLALGGSPKDDPATTALLAEAVRTAAPGGAPSPHLRIIAADDPAEAAQLLVSAPRPGTVRICGAAANTLTPDAPCTTPSEAASVVADLEHIARWQTISELRNPATRLAHAVHIELVHAADDAQVDPRTGVPLDVGSDGALHLRYHRVDGEWTPPQAFIRLRNTTGRPLHCVLLDLTDRYRIYTGLFPGAWVGAHYTASVADGAPIGFKLPPDRPTRSGAKVTDRLMLLVTEEPIGSTPFTLPRLGEPAAPETRSRSPFRNTLERLGLTALYRDAEIEGGAAKDWTTETLTVVTDVP